MKPRISPAILCAAAGFVLLWHAPGSEARFRLATGAYEDVTEEGLHRVHPSVMEAAWVIPELDLSGYTRVFLVPTGVQFRDVSRRTYGLRSRDNVAEFPIDDAKKEWLRGTWQRVVTEQFALQRSFDAYDGVGSGVLIVQGFLVDVVSRIPPVTVGSDYTLVRDPWSANVVLELRDGTTGDLLARTIDLRTGEGLLEADSAWAQTPDLLERWAQVIFERLEQLADLGGVPDVGHGVGSTPFG